MMWTSPPPMSTNAFVPFAEYTCGVQVGSLPSYAVTVPCVTITRLGPGCVCQPLLGMHGLPGSGGQGPQEPSVPCVHMLGSHVFCWT